MTAALLCKGVPASFCCLGPSSHGLLFGPALGRLASKAQVMLQANRWYIGRNVSLRYILDIYAYAHERCSPVAAPVEWRLLTTKNTKFFVHGSPAVRALNREYPKALCSNSKARYPITLKFYTLPVKVKPLYPKAIKPQSPINRKKPYNITERPFCFHRGKENIRARNWSPSLEN